MEVMLLVWKVERFVIQDVKQEKLSILEKDNGKATLFMTGSMKAEYSESAKCGNWDENYYNFYLRKKSARTAAVRVFA